MSCVCAIDRATLTSLVQDWVPQVQISGLHELVGNALVFVGEKWPRAMDLREDEVYDYEEPEEEPEEAEAAEAADGGDE
jgi:hypothetical protein